MGIPFPPPGMAWLSYLVGVKLPTIDEDDVGQVQQGFEHLQQNINGTVIPVVAMARNKSRRAYPEGDGADGIDKYLARIISHNKSVAGGYGELAKGIHSYRGQVVSAKLNGIFGLIWMGTEFASSSLWGPGAPLQQAYAVASTRIFFRWLASRVTQETAEILARMATRIAIEDTPRLVQWITSDVAKEIFKHMGKEAFQEFYQGTGQELLVEAEMIREGYQEKLDWEAIKQNAVISTIAGGIGGIGGLGMQKLTQKFNWNSGARWDRIRTGVVVGGGAGLIGQVGAMVSNGLIYNNWQTDIYAWSGGVAGGAVPGVIGGFRAPRVGEGQRMRRSDFTLIAGQPDIGDGTTTSNPTTTTTTPPINTNTGTNTGTGTGTNTGAGTGVGVGNGRASGDTSPTANTTTNQGHSNTTTEPGHAEGNGSDTAAASNTAEDGSPQASQASASTAPPAAAATTTTETGAGPAGGAVGTDPHGGALVTGTQHSEPTAGLGSTGNTAADPTPVDGQATTHADTPAPATGAPPPTPPPPTPLPLVGLPPAPLPPVLVGLLLVGLLLVDRRRGRVRAGVRRQCRVARARPVAVVHRVLPVPGARRLPCRVGAVRARTGHGRARYRIPPIPSHEQRHALPVPGPPDPTQRPLSATS
ncbi:hypothetical protein OHB12_29250 [Nocardia sp. NBC_01730]|uniref:hypothetical protein n=1 Tax=Nocardia sp. NBC_01730 TaxID=2975998 RepID=UPI002E11B9A7|nr:hypothetical protein OHB12_29250 [Nocardia sp. NBC_01730]